MDWDEADFKRRLKSALESFDVEQVDDLCGILTAHLHTAAAAPGEPFAKWVLSALQRKRCFQQLRCVADAFIQGGLATPRVRRQYAQALLDQGELSAAIPFLKALVTDAEADPGQAFELAEAKGLLGRVYKQIYVNTGAARSDRSAAVLNDALGAYLAVYEAAPETHSWHGINAVALLARAEGDLVTVDGIDDPGGRSRQIAAEVLGRLTELWDNRRATMWDSGTAMEACVALARNEEAALWLQRYVSEPQADAFEIGSTLRQLDEVWRLDMESEPGSSLLPVLRAELLNKQGGGFTLNPKDLHPGALANTTPEHLEKILGTVRYHSYKFMLRAIDRARAVARIEHQPGQGYGTGFLVRAPDLNPGIGDGYVLITNAHVVSNDPNVKDALAPEDAIVTFQLLREEGGAEEEYQVEKLLWTSPPWELDATVLRLARVPEKVEPFPVQPRLPLPDGEQRVYVIGHPKGGSLSFSMQDNVLLDHESPYLHYRAPTEGGSSGSPVFNAQWKLIGLHHAGSHEMRRLHAQPGTYAANEGIWMQSIIQAMAAQLPAAV